LGGGQSFSEHRRLVHRRNPILIGSALWTLIAELTTIFPISFSIIRDILPPASLKGAKARKVKTLGVFWRWKLLPCAISPRFHNNKILSLYKGELFYYCIPTGGILMRNLLLTLKEELREKLQGKIWPRKISLPSVDNKIHVITGMRRTGKSFFLLRQIKDLIETGSSEESILYLNFEDDRLLPMGKNRFAELIAEFYSLWPDNHDRRCYLFFDEIQNVEGWQTVVRRIFDSKNVKLFLSGSSAKLLSREISTSLRGRSITTEMWPLDFDEHPSIESYPENMGAGTFDKFMSALNSFLYSGGFPETVFYDSSTRTRVLQDYVDVVIYRDIIERHNISNTTLIKTVIRSLIHSAGRQLSVNKLYNDMKSRGIKASKNTLYEYMEYIEDAYLAFTVPLFSESIRKVQSNPKKVYIVDTGLITAFTLNIKSDSGQLFENLIYLGLRRKLHEVFYYITRNRHEVDFVTKNLDGGLSLFQVCFDIRDQKTMERELRALKEAEDELNVKGEIITPQNYISFLCS
jgi:uncharacterized protein